MLSAPIFQRIVALFGKPDIDLFASRLNAQVEDYVSWKPHPMAKFVDAFTIFLLCLSSILSCFKVCTENNSRPGIRNSSNSLVDNSALFYGCTEPTNRNATCFKCFSSGSDSSNSGRSSFPTLTTAVDGMQAIKRSLQSLKFRQVTLSTSSCIHRETAHRNNIKCGCNFAVKSHMIHCIPL